MELVILHPNADDDHDSAATEPSSQPGQQTELDTTEISEYDGDALSQADESTPVVETDSNTEQRSASSSRSDAAQQEEPPDDSSFSSSHTVRRPTRERKPPAWMRSGKYDLLRSVCSVTHKDWYQKTQCITSLADTNMFHDLQKEAATTILDIIKTPSGK